MNTDFAYDPAAVLEEADASGPVAATFAEIRRVMGIPLVTSIWRALAGMGDALDRTWIASRGIYESGEPERALQRVIETAPALRVSRLTNAQLSAIDMGEVDLVAARSVIAAYNRSNGMNLVALAALVNEPVAGTLTGAWQPGPEWPTLPVLMRRAEIPDTAWRIVQEVNRFGAPNPAASVATLWRHLAHWPALLALASVAFDPLQTGGAIDDATARIVRLAASEGARMASLRRNDVVLDPQVLAVLGGYVGSPGQVARMVTMGHALAVWIDSIAD